MRKTDWALVDRIEREGVQAEARLNGVLRGGHVFEGRFYAFVNPMGLISGPLAEVSELRATGERALDYVHPTAPKAGERGRVRFPNGNSHDVQVLDVQEDGSGLGLVQVRDGRVESFRHRMVRGKDGLYRTPVADGVLEIGGQS